MIIFLCVVISSVGTLIPLDEVAGESCLVVDWILLNLCCAVLEIFYNATAGPFWDYSTNWLDGDPCDNGWFGIECDLDGTTIVAM